MDPWKFKPYRSLTKYRSEPTVFDDQLQTLIDVIQSVYYKQKTYPATSKIAFLYLMDKLEQHLHHQLQFQLRQW